MYKIMIIEDDLSIAESLKDYIEKYSYQVFIVKNFEKIIEEFNEYKPDLVLLDLNLPIYDGFFWC